MSDELYCEHCGDVAISNETGLFFDGEGEACVTCGYPGSVSVDEDCGAYWNPRDEADTYCKEPACGYCMMNRKEEGNAS